MFLIIAIISVAVMTIDNKVFGQYLTSGTLNGHEWVDLGLPSGTKWATCNVGASTPKRCGNYYEGEKDVFGDAGYEHWEGWQVPTEDQIKELRDECKWTFTSSGSGAKVVGPNGNSIFLPFAGHSYYNGDDGWYDPSEVTRAGYYWSSRWGYYLKIIRGCDDCQEISKSYTNFQWGHHKISLRLVVESD